MKLSELKKRYSEAFKRAEGFKSSIEAADAPSADDLEGFKKAHGDATALEADIAAAEAREAAFGQMQKRASQTDAITSPVLMPYNDPANTRNGRHAYSMMRCIKGQLDGIYGRGGVDGIELETHQELARIRSAMGGKAPTGILVPMDAPISYGNSVQYRDLTTSTGAGAVPNPTATARMIDILRPRMALNALGATVITDMTTPFSIPKTTATVTVGHVTTEGTNASKSNPTIGDLDFTYKSIEATTRLTRQFINSASIQAESYVVDQLTQAVSGAVEGEAFNGPGSTKRVKGLFLYAAIDGINVLARGTNGDVPTWATLLGMTGAVDMANAPDSARKWLFNPATVACLQATPKVSTHPTYILGDNNTVGGYTYVSTSRVRGDIAKGSGSNLSQLAFGAWSEVLVALFSGIDLYVDPFSEQPHVNITAAIDFDVNFAHLESFSICNDLKTS